VFFCSHVVARLFMGFGLLLLTIMTTSPALSLLLAILASVIIRMLDGNWLTSMRLLYLLRWFVIPILLLHMFFTPGQLLFPDWPVGVSREGLMQGIRLSLHLTSMYAMAIMIFRLLGHAEWLRVLMRLPWFGERMMVQALMMMSMKQHMSRLLFYLRQQFRLRYDWKKSPLLLMSAFRQALADASTHAQMIWLRWPQQPSMLISVHVENSMSVFHHYLFSALWAVVGCISLLLPWLT